MRSQLVSLTQFSRSDTPVGPVPPDWLSGEEVISVADIIRALGAPGIWLAVPRCVVRLKTAGRHWWGDEGNEHWRGLGPLGDQLTQGVRRVRARPTFLQSLQLPHLPKPQDDGDTEECSEGQASSSHQECVQWYQRCRHWDACRI